MFSYVIFGDGVTGLVTSNKGTGLPKKIPKLTKMIDTNIFGTNFNG